MKGKKTRTPRKEEGSNDIKEEGKEEKRIATNMKQSKRKGIDYTERL